MTDEELERLRPAHVSMGGMRLWRYARLSLFVPLAGLLLTLLFGYLGVSEWMIQLTVAATFGSFALAFLYWLGVVAFVFLKYSLQSLMLGVLLTATIASLIVALPGNWKGIPVLAAVFWFAVLFLTIADHDPERRAQFHGLPKKPPTDKADEEDGSERVP